MKKEFSNYTMAGLGFTALGLVLRQFAPQAEFFIGVSAGAGTLLLLLGAIGEEKRNKLKIAKQNFLAKVFGSAKPAE
jgi:hypothetical protein